MNDTNKLQPLRVESVYNVSATTLFDAWVMSPVAELWLFQHGKNEVVDYIKIDRPNSLVFSMTAPDHVEGSGEVTVEIREEQIGSRLLLTQKNADAPKTAVAWRNLLVQMDDLFKTPYTVNDRSEKKEIISAISIVAMQMLGYVLSMDEGQVNSVPYTNGWTAAQLSRHIILSIRGMAAAIRKEPKPANREITKRIVEIKQTFLDITRTFPSPDGIVPEQKKYELRTGSSRIFKMALPN